MKVALAVRPMMSFLMRSDESSSFDRTRQNGRHRIDFSDYLRLEF